MCYLFELGSVCAIEGDKEHWEDNKDHEDGIHSQVPESWEGTEAC